MTVFITVRTLDICLYIFLVTIEWLLILLTRVFLVFLRCKNANTIYYKKSVFSIVVKKKMYTKC